MHRFKPFFSHSIFISICAAALAIQTYVLCGPKSIDYTSILFIAVATLGAYNFYWYIATFKRKQASGEHGFFQKGLYLHLLLMLIPGLVLICLLWQHKDWISFFVIGTVISMGYTLLVFAKNKLQQLRVIGIFKTILLTVAWTFITAVFPILHAEKSIESNQLLLVANRFVFVLMIAIIFDARDIEKDQLSGTGTIATVFGRKQLQVFMTGLLLAFVVITWMMLLVGVICKLMMLACGAVVYILYFLAQTSRSDAYYYFLTDGMMIIFSLAVYVTAI